MTKALKALIVSELVLLVLMITSVLNSSDFKDESGYAPKNEWDSIFFFSLLLFLLLMFPAVAFGALVIKRKISK